MSSEFEKHSITYYARFLILFQYERLFCWVNVPPFFIRYNLASFFRVHLFRIRCKLQNWIIQGRKLREMLRKQLNFQGINSGVGSSQVLGEVGGRLG